MGQNRRVIYCWCSTIRNVNIAVKSPLLWLLTKMLAELQEKGLLTVLAIDTESDGDVWERTKRDMPHRWIVGHDDNNVITESALYDLPAMPVLYLLDADKTVILKDVAPDAILRELARL